MSFDVQAWLQQHLPGGRPTGSGWYRIKCPFHQESSPSFAVNLQNGSFGCLAASCKRHGGIALLVKEVEQITWREALERVRLPNSFDAFDEIPRLRDDRVERPPENPFPEQLVPVSMQRYPVYLRDDRRYWYRDVERFGLHFGVGGELMGWMVFPFWDLDGRYRTWRARIMADDRPQRYTGPAEGIGSQLLYGAWLLGQQRQIDRIFIVEGQFDVMRCWQHGLAAGGLSTAEASAAQQNQIVLLARQFNAPVCVLLDAGDNEHRAAVTLAGQLRRRGARAYSLALPDGIKDPDLLRDPEDVGKLLDKCHGAELLFGPTGASP